MEQLIASVQKELLAQGKTISTAESCTGGRVAAALTLLPGSSDVFLGGLVAYSNAVKQQVLGVQAETLAQYGAVSQQTVQEMAQASCELFQSDFSLASSGVAGPGGGTPFSPVGLVWLAIGRRGESPFAWKEQFFGSREEVMAQACNSLLKQLVKSFI